MTLINSVCFEVAFLKSPVGIGETAVLVILLAATTTAIAVRTCPARLAKLSARPRNDAAYNSALAERKAAPEEDDALEAIESRAFRDPEATSLASYSHAGFREHSRVRTPPQAMSLPYSAS